MAARVNNTLDEDIKLLAGITANAATLPSFTLAGTTSTPADCESVLQARVAAATLVSTTRGAWQKSVEANRQEVASTQPFVTDLKNQIILMHSNSPDILSQYGLKPRKKAATQTTAVKVVAVEKRKATRTERNTMGTQQKKKVKGVLPATIQIAVSDGVALAPPEPSPTPAATAALATAAPHGDPGNTSK
jgi:hypothetical protein